MSPFNMKDHSIWHHSSWHNSVNLKTNSFLASLSTSSTTSWHCKTAPPPLPRDRRLHHLQLLQRRHHSFTCIEKIRLRTSDSASAEDSWTDSVTSVPSDCLRRLLPKLRSSSKCETRIGIGF